MGLTGGRTKDKLAAEENKTHPEDICKLFKEMSMAWNHQEEDKEEQTQKRRN